MPCLASRSVRTVVLLGFVCAIAGVDESPDDDEQDIRAEVADTLRNPAKMLKAMEILQDPVQMQELQDAMSDPEVQEKMKRIVGRMGDENPELKELINTPTNLDLGKIKEALSMTNQGLKTAEGATARLVTATNRFVQKKKQQEQ